MRSSGILRRLAILVATGILAAGLVVGTRAVTTALVGPGGASAEAAEGDLEAETSSIASSADDQALPTTSTSAAESVPSTGPSVTATTLPRSSTTENPSQTPDADGWIIGEPIVTPRQQTTFRDQLTVHPAATTGFPIEAAPFDPGSGSDDDSGTGVIDGVDVTNGEAAPRPRPFAVGVRVEAESHFAVIRVGVDAGPAGLSDLVVDFGDGEMLNVSQDQIDQVGDVGTIEIVHRYEPTLTPQPQTVRATATDGAGNTKVANTNFETQAQFLVTYSPMTITALDDCDLFGKGDFELNWNNEGRDRRSRFDLGKGDSYVEEEFRAGIDGVRYEQEISLTFRIRERDAAAVEFLRVYRKFTLADALDNPDTELFVDVMELGSHTIPISLYYDVRDDCDAQVDVRITLALSERKPR